MRVFTAHLTLRMIFEQIEEISAFSFEFEIVSDRVRRSLMSEI